MDSIAVIPVCGILVHGSGYGFSGMAETSYADIRRALAAAVDADDVSGIALYIDSPGGEVAGCADLGDIIYAARAVKPIHAICDEMACSAAYWLASACDRITVPRTGVLGSIGVLTLRTDMTGALDKAGIEVTTIQYGDRKTDSYPTTKLTASARDRLQADIDQLGDLFTRTVARNRGMKPQAVRDFQAGTFLGRDAVRAGLADDVASADVAFLALMDAATETQTPRATATRPSARAASSTTTKGKTVGKDFSHLIHASGRQEVAAAEPPDPDAERKARIRQTVRAGYKARGETPPDVIDTGPEQPRRVKTSAADIIAAGKRAGIL
ncbi:MAG: S49 family peptidase [Janthinobacterium lividum]